MDIVTRRGTRMRQLHMGYISPYTRKVRVALAEKGLEYENVVTSGAAADASYNQLNPARRVPTLIDGDTVMFESNEILQYLMATYPENNPSPDGIPFATRLTRPEHYWYDRQTFYMLDTMLDSGLNLLYFRNEGMTEEHAEFLGRERKRIQVILDWLEPRATPEGFLPGEFSLQDLCFVISVQWSDYRKMFEWRGRPNLDAIVERYKDRPSIVSTHPDLAPA